MAGVFGAGTAELYCLYNLGQISVSCPNGLPVVGGVAGSINSLTSGYNVGVISYETAGTKRIGAVIGALVQECTNTYYLNNTELNGIGRKYNNNAVQPTKVETIDEMATVLEIMGDEFKEDTNNINNGYPILKWQ